MSQSQTQIAPVPEIVPPVSLQDGDSGHTQQASAQTSPVQRPKADGIDKACVFMRTCSQAMHVSISIILCWKVFQNHLDFVPR